MERAVAEAKSKEELLHERWEGQEERIQKIVDSLRKGEDWTVHLAGLPFVEEIKARNSEGFGRDFRGASLKGRNLEKLNLSWADFSGADLYGASLSGANLEWANLSKARLDEANLVGANLRFASLGGANLSLAILSEADLGQASLSEANLEWASLSDANLYQATLLRANLHHANLSGAKLTWASFDGADLSSADLREAELIMANLSMANLTWAKLTGAGLGGADLKGSILDAADLENAHIFGVKYDRSITCRGIRIATAYGSPSFKRFAQDQDFLQEFEQSTKGSKRLRMIYYLWKYSSDFGRSALRWTAWSVFLAVAFASGFLFLGDGAFESMHLTWSFWTALYYSVVTFTTLGFGDVVPKTYPAAFVVMAEVITGYVMLGGLISIFANKLARRS